MAPHSHNSRDLNNVRFGEGCDIGTVWTRIFDHKAFLSGEISFLVAEFEQKRKDTEVDHLFNVFEKITDVKDTQIAKLQGQTEDLNEVNEHLVAALQKCSRFVSLEEKFKNDTTISDTKENRKEDWNNFMDKLTARYSEKTRMISHKAQINDPRLKIQPTEKFVSYISKIKDQTDVPPGIAAILFKNKKVQDIITENEHKTFITNSDRQVINNLTAQEIHTTASKKTLKVVENKPLTLTDLYWLQNYLIAKNQTETTKVYFHELFEGSQIVLPQNVEVPRNPELEKRCQRLKNDWDNLQYHNITKNVDGVRRKLPEDTLAYQMKQMNKHIIAIFQFVVSVLAGFAFGFIGIEVFTGSLDFGFRLLLGIICALVIALAELYFLAKQLNEDMYFEQVGTGTQKMKKNQ